MRLGKHAIWVVGSATAAVMIAAGEMRGSPTMTAGSTVVSDYLFRGQRLAGLSLQPAIEVDVGESSAAISANFALDRRAKDVAESEFDFLALHRFAITPRAVLVPTLAIYTYPSAPKQPGYRRSVLEPSVALHYTVGPVRLTPSVSYDFTRRGPTFELGSTTALPLARFGTELDLTAFAGTYRLHDAFTDPGANTKLTGNYWSIDATVPYQINAASRIAGGVSYAAGTNSYLQRGGAPRAGNPLASRRGIIHATYTWTY